MENHVWHPLAHSSLPYSRSGTVRPTRPGIFQVLSPEPEEGHIEKPCLAPFGESHIPTHFHTYPRSTRKFWWVSGAPAVIPLFQNGGMRTPTGLPP